MNKLWRVLGGLDEMSFKRTPDGWLFAAPSMWPLRQTYRVTDEQKAKLVGPLRRILAVQLVAVIAVVIVLTQVLANDQPLTRWFVIGIVTLMLMILSWAYAAFTFRPLLSGLTPTDQRITFSDRFKRQATTFPKALIVSMLLASLVFVVGSVAIVVHGGWDLTTIAGMAFFGILTLYWTALLFAGRRRTAQ